MGHRFYTQRDNLQSKFFGKGHTMVQKTEKPKRVLKKDVVAEFEKLVGCECPGLDRLTIAAIEHLQAAVEAKLNVKN